MVAVGDWIEAELHAQRKFFHGISCMMIALALRWRGVLKPDDSIVISKLTFQLFMPALLFSSVWKAPFSGDLGQIAAASIATHVALVAFVLSIARLVPDDPKGFRGQFIFCMMGNNIGFSYPLVLSIPAFRETLFPALVVWDLSGNAVVILIVNLLVASSLSPKQTMEEIEERAGMTQAMDNMSPTLGGRTSSKSELPVDTAGDKRGIGHSIEDIDIEVPGESADARQHNEAPNPSSSLPPESPDSGANRRRSLHILGLSIKASAGVIDTFRLPALRESGAFTKTFILKIITNTQIAAICIAIVINLSGGVVPEVVDEFTELLGQPYSVLFFMLLGLNLLWAVIRPRLRMVFFIIAGRTLIAATLAVLFWLVPFMPNLAHRQAAVFGLLCPMSGVSMGYCISYGYDRQLQAALATTSNLMAFLALLTLTVSY